MAADTTKQGKSANPHKGVDSEAGSPTAAAKPGRDPARRLFTIKGLIIVMVVSLVAHGIGLGYSRYARGRTDVADKPSEISLGSYHFEAEPSEQGDIVGAKFCLYIALVDEVEPSARQTLAQRQARVQQNVEELLRQAHGGDFVDPALSGLKRQLQERINETLGARMIDDVIITNLEVHRRHVTAKPAATTVGSPPWVEEPSS